MQDHVHGTSTCTVIITNVNEKFIMKATQLINMGWGIYLEYLYITTAGHRGLRKNVGLLT
jgi:hypothetical protein